MRLQNTFFKNTDRWAYNISFIQHGEKTPFLERHQIALDHVLAQRLAVPGLDRQKFAPALAVARPVVPKAKAILHKLPVAHGGALPAHDRFAYNLSMLTQDTGKAFVERHQIALDFALALSLAVPGLDAAKIGQPRYVGGPIAQPGAASTGNAWFRPHRNFWQNAR